MAFDYTNLYPDTSGNGGYTKSWNYTTVSDSIAVVGASGYFNKVATRVGIGDNIVVAVVDAFDKARTTLIDQATFFVTGISGGVVTTTNAKAYAFASPVLTGIPTAPTAAPGNNSTQIATTAYADAIAALKANLASPALTGVPTAPTAAPATNTTQLATTAYADAIAALKANLASPALTGVPTAPTAAVDTNTTQLATTAMVLAQAASATPLINATVAVVGTSTRFARGDHVHPTDTTRAPLASPAFTGDVSVVGFVQTGGDSRVTTQFNKTTDAVLGNVPGLSATLSAGLTYGFSAKLYVVAGASGGVQAAVGGTVTATAFQCAQTIINPTGLSFGQTTTIGAAATGSTGTTSGMIMLEGAITVNAGGTLTAMFAQNASNATPSSVLVGSTMKVWKIA